MQISDLPALNATLNAVSALFLTAGYLLIRRGDRVNHQRAMLGALGTSALFLVSYVTYHLNVGSKPFPGEGPVRAVYLTILLTHIVLAAVILPMALVTANPATPTWNISRRPWSSPSRPASTGTSPNDSV